MMRLRLLIVGVFITVFLNKVYAQDTFNIIPRPNSIRIYNGAVTLKDSVLLFVKNERQMQEAAYFSRALFSLSGTQINYAFRGNHTGDVYVRIFEDTLLPDEGYKLTVTENFISIKGRGAGTFYAFQTLLQIIHSSKEGTLTIPCCEINDYPTFKWRGMHLDVSRHFFPKDSIKRYLDAMAVYKMNVFHWHLTDDQGWRIEIKKYPKLTIVGAYRKETVVGKHFNPYVGDGIRHGGYYTQEDIKEIVRYATNRHITIVPEIEMPGHCQAALAAYPEFSTTGGPFQVMTTWGESADVFNPGKETFKFLEDILTEVMALFPGKYIHIGGDEVSKTQWHNNPFCRQLMKKMGLKNEDELQSYFIKHIDSFITAKGRATIGWDEILEGGIAPNAAIMSWRGVAGGKAAARLNHNVVMCPGAYCYFDHYQGSPKMEPLAIGGYTTVEKVYSYDPIPDSLLSDQQKYIMGAQGNVWTEYIPTFEHAEYMALPRMCALSEVLWTTKKYRNYDNFKMRLLKHFDYLDKFNIKYATSMLNPEAIVKPGNNGHALRVSFKQFTSDCEMIFPGKAISFSTTEPMRDSFMYVDSSRRQTILSSLKGRIMGYPLDLDFHVNKATGKPITLEVLPSPSYNNGGAFTLVDGIHDSMPWYGKEWLGWSGKDCIATVDLGKIQDISGFKVGLLNDHNSWIYASKHIEVWISNDNKEFMKISDNMLSDIIDGINRPDLHFTSVKAMRARYVKLKIHNYGKIPEGNPGAEHDAWLFVDEIEIE